MSVAIHPRKQSLRIALFLLVAVLAFVVLNVGFQAVSTLERLNAVEAERDTWQRPEDAIKCLNLHEGSLVADLGSGSGYFSLKLSRAVGDSGQVIAVDIRRLPLAFLQIRATMQRRWNIRTQKTEPNDPELPEGLDAILIANTYHELTDRALILNQVHRALRRGGRLVIIDRGPRATDLQPGESGHELPLATVETDLLAHGFTIVKREEPFIDRPPDEPWWLIVASRF